MAGASSKKMPFPPPLRMIMSPVRAGETVTPITSPALSPMELTATESPVTVRPLK